MGIAPVRPWNVDKQFRISIDGVHHVGEWPEPEGDKEFVALEFAVPGRDASSRSHVDVAITALREHVLIYEIAVLAAVDPN